MAASGTRQRLLAACFVAVAGLVVAGGAITVRTFRQEHRRDAEALLTSVADLKVGELLQWRRERLGDVRAARDNPVFAEMVGRVLGVGADPDTRRQLEGWLESIRSAFDYDRVMLLDAQGAMRASCARAAGGVPIHLDRDAPELVFSSEASFLDFHRDEDDRKVFLATVAPIRDPANGEPLALLVMRIDPATYLYPLIQTWPTASRTAETLLVRREGDEVVYLNELRFASGTALQLRRSLASPNLPAALAAAGTSGVVEGEDYRGVRVLAALRQIPGSDWALVARMDLDEIDGPLHERLTMLAVLVTALLGLVGASWAVLWRQQRVRHFRQRYEVERQFRMLFENMTEGVVLHELVRTASGEAVDYRILDCNPAFERHTGIPVERARGALGSQLYGVDSAPYLDVYARVAETGEPFRFEVYFASLQRHFSISAVSPRRGQFATVFEDITEGKQREQELRRKTEEMERFTYTISHDLKSPLVTVQTFLGYLAQDLERGDRESWQQDMEYIGSAAGRMARLLDELLRMSRLGRVVNPPARVSLGELVAEAVAAVAGQIAARKVEVEVVGGEIALTGDRPRLVEIWQNLLDNAVKFMGDQPRPRVEMGVEVRAQETVFYVRDNGQGIDPRHQNKVFNLFERLDAGSEGTGLGLAMAKRIVELYEGQIWVDSAGAGQGSCFRFTLPLALVEPKTKGAS
jgi:signal transduction histidine kinase